MRTELKRTRISLVKIVTGRFKVLTWTLLTTSVIPTFKTPFHHPIYYSQSLRSGRLVDIWSDLALALVLVVGFIGKLICFKKPFEIITILFAVRAAVHQQIHVQEIALYADVKILTGTNTQSE